MFKGIITVALGIILAELLSGFIVNPAVRFIMSAYYGF